MGKGRLVGFDSQQVANQIICLKNHLSIVARPHRLKRTGRSGEENDRTSRNSKPNEPEWAGINQKEPEGARMKKKSRTSHSHKPRDVGECSKVYMPENNILMFFFKFNLNDLKIVCLFLVFLCLKILKNLDKEFFVLLLPWWAVEIS